MLFDSYLNSCPGGGSLDVEVALCHAYNTLTHHHTKPGFNNLIPLLQVAKPMFYINQEKEGLFNRQYCKGWSLICQLY